VLDSQRTLQPKLEEGLGQGRGSHIDFFLRLVLVTGFAWATADLTLAIWHSEQSSLPKIFSKSTSWKSTFPSAPSLMFKGNEQTRNFDPRLVKVLILGGEGSPDG
jgi:hypothetical protein